MKLKENYEKSSRIEEEILRDKSESQAEMDGKTIINAIEEVNKKIQVSDKEFQFSVHEKTNQMLVKVIDKQSGKIIKEFPPEKILDMIAKMWEMAGLFVDEKR
jgi:flagellar protein FlaG